MRRERATEWILIAQDMEIELKRIAKKMGYTIGRLYVNGVKVCDTLEDTDRGLTSSMSLLEIKKKKVSGKTAIPTGVYDVTMQIKSPRFGSQTFYKNLCDGYLPRLVSVPGYEGVLIHCGNTADDTEGCILCGYNEKVGMVINSRAAFTNLMKDYLLNAKKMGERIRIKIS